MAEATLQERVLDYAQIIDTITDDDKEFITQTIAEGCYETVQKIRDLFPTELVSFTQTVSEEKLTEVADAPVDYITLHPRVDLNYGNGIEIKNKFISNDYYGASIDSTTTTVNVVYTTTDTTIQVGPAPLLVAGKYIKIPKTVGSLSLVEYMFIQSKVSGTLTDSTKNIDGSSYTDAVETINVESGGGATFTASTTTVPSYIKIGTEILYITSISTDALVVKRGQLGTTAIAIPASTDIYIQTSDTLTVLRGQLGSLAFGLTGSMLIDIQTPVYFIPIDIYDAVRYGSDNAETPAYIPYECGEVHSGQRAMLTEPDSFLFATPEHPVYYRHKGKLFVSPNPIDVNTRFEVSMVSTIDANSLDISGIRILGFPEKFEFAPILYSAIKLLTKQLDNFSLKEEEDLELVQAYTLQIKSLTEQFTVALGIPKKQKEQAVEG